ncbi:hypothetical protein LTR85_010259 [Meristemomyces frigidus]|nr:hypothetical protein LTR85_010259 [Meristemomyces frigidus]
MRSNIILAAALARIAAAAPAPAPQQFDFDAILNAPSPTATVPPVIAVASSSTTFSIDTASLAASIAAEITTAATASITGASASAASTEEPTTTVLDKRGNTQKTTSSSIWSTSTSTKSSSKSSSTLSSSTSSAKSSSVPVTSSTSTSTLQQSSSTTSSSSTACPTTPEAGTYCGFINPEDACAPQPAGSGPQVQPDTVAAFYAYPAFMQDALNAKTPSGYVETFKNLNASTSANSYLTYETLTSYNVSGCASFCDNTDLCTAFNIYIERDPSVNPTTNGTDIGWGSDCPNPSSITNYKCSLWGSNIDASSATNFGDYRDEFQVVIAGSNGYDKTNNTTPATQPGWSAPSGCSGGAISSGGSYWMGSNFYPGPFDPSVCAIYAQAQTSTNKQVAQQKGAKSYTPCNMFNAYMVQKNGIAQGTYCQLYDTVLSDSWASFSGAWSGATFFGVTSSWTYSLSELLDGKL